MEPRPNLDKKGDLSMQDLDPLKLWNDFKWAVQSLSNSKPKENPYYTIRFIILFVYLAHNIILAGTTDGSVYQVYSTSILLVAVFFSAEYNQNLASYGIPTLIIYIVYSLTNLDLYYSRFVLLLCHFTLFTRNNFLFSLFLQLEAVIIISLDSFNFEVLIPDINYSIFYMFLSFALLSQSKHADFSSGQMKKNSIEVETVREQIKLQEKKIEELKDFHKNFLLSVSHEIRNPLNSIVGNVELLQKSFSENDQLYQVAKTARYGCEVLLNLVNNVLDASKIESDELDIHPVSTNVKQFFEKTWALFAQMISQKNIDGEIYLHKNIPAFLFIDQARVHQMLMNLVDNSLKFTEKGFIKIIVSWFPAQIEKAVPNSPKQIININYPDMVDNNECEVSAAYEDDFEHQIVGNYKINFSPSMNYCKLDLIKKKFRSGECNFGGISPLASQLGYLKMQVIDTGIGIHYEKSKKLFQKFMKVTEGQRKEGSGLGLWITKQLCKKMNGSISVESEVNKGCTFTIFIKAEFSPQTVVPSPKERTKKQLPGSLIVNRGSDPTSSKFNGNGVNGSRDYVRDILKLPEGVVAESPEKPKEEITLRAMIVDDFPYNQQLNKKFLELSNVEVKSVAGNGQEALDQFIDFGQNGIDLVFMDLDMPVMNGKDSCKRIREYEKANKWAPVIIVILTGNCTEQELQECMDRKGSIRADFFYRKPMPLQDCQNLIDLITRQKLKKKSMNIILPGLSDQVLVYERELYTKHMIENYMKIGFVKYRMMKREEIAREITSNYDSIKAVLMNCEEDPGYTKEFITKARAIVNEKREKRILLVAIIDEKQLEAEKKNLLELGFDEILTKPINYQKLMALVKT